MSRREWIRALQCCVSVLQRDDQARTAEGLRRLRRVSAVSPISAATSKPLKSGLLRVEIRPTFMLRSRDGQQQLVWSDADISAIAYCGWGPASAEKFTVVVPHKSGTPPSYLVITN